MFQKKSEPPKVTYHLPLVPHRVLAIEKLEKQSQTINYLQKFILGKFVTAEHLTNIVSSQLELNLNHTFVDFWTSSILSIIDKLKDLFVDGDEANNNRFL